MSRRVRLREERKRIEFWCAKCRRWEGRSHHVAPSVFISGQPGSFSPVFGFDGGGAAGAVSINLIGTGTATLQESVATAVRVRRLASDAHMRTARA